MHDDDYGKFCETVKKHFTKATEGDIDLLWKDVREFDFASVEAAIEQHHRDLGERAWRPASAKVRGIILRASQRGYAPTRNREDRVIDWLRKTNPQRWYGVTDLSALTQHFRESWIAVRDGCLATDKSTGEVYRQPGAPDEYSRQWVRNLIRVHAKVAFMQIDPRPAKESEADAAEKAAVIVDLAEGEKIHLVPLVKSVDDVRSPTSQQALRQLAEHELELQREAVPA